METILSNSLTPQIQPPHHSFQFPSLYPKLSNFIKFSHKTWIYTPKAVSFCSSTASGSLSYGGWDELRLGADSFQSGESNQLRNFMNSLGFDDKKYIFVYLLGFVCALAISRVRVSSIIVIPACVVVFAVGFSFGFVNAGQVNELSLIGTKKKPKNKENGNINNISVQKLRNLMDLFSGVDGQIERLKNDIRRCINTGQVTVDDLENYVMTMESFGSFTSNAKTIVQACVDSMLVENQEVEQTLKTNLSKKKKESEGTRFDLSQFMASMFRENSTSTKPNKMKDVSKKESINMEVNENHKRSILAPTVDERSANSLSNGNVVNGHAKFSVDNDGTRKSKVIAENEGMNMLESDDGAGRHFDNNRVSFMENEQNSLNHNSVREWTSDDDLLDLDFNVSLKRTRMKASLRQEQTFKKINGNHMPSDSTTSSNKESYESRINEKVFSEDDPFHTNSQSAHKSKFASSSSSKVLDDIEFNRCLMEANVLLKQARESLRHRGNEGDAENALQKSAVLLSKAIEMKPMSLLAMGQLGNTYLLHGELKLKVSRELRALLERSDSSSLEYTNNSKGLTDWVDRKEEVANVLVNVCEECEELLVKAGRKYRSALTIDGDDMRALYNWGLALSFRAQLIADIGPEAAVDADNVFLAAIDKFDAMMSKSNTHAPEALFRWGVALQQRSRLKTRNSREKVKLLQQAKRLYEDALNIDSDNLQVRKALVACISEMNYRNY